MAPGLKHWVGALLLGMMAITIWALPLRQDPPPVDDRVTPQMEHFQRLQHDLLLEREHLRRLDWLDSWTAALQSAEGTPAVVVIGDERMHDDSIRVLEERVLREVSLVDSPRADIAIFVTRPPPHDPPDDPAWRLSHGEYYVGVSSERPYCVFARFLDPSATARSSLSPLEGAEVGGSCVYVLRYGQPGASISEWLKEGSFVRGTNRTLRGYVFQFVTSVDEWAGDPAGPLSPLSMEARRCLHRDLESCTEIFLHPIHFPDSVGIELGARVPELWGMLGGMAGSPYHFGIVEPIMLAALEREFGEESFERFWTSDREVTVAFEEAFGVTPGAWLHDWARGYYSRPTTLRAGFGQWAATILALLGALLMVRRVIASRSVA